MTRAGTRNKEEKNALSRNIFFKRAHNPYCQIENHLTEKSVARVHHVCGFYSNIEMLEALFAPDSKYRPHLEIIVNSLNTLIESGEI